MTVGWKAAAVGAGLALLLTACGRGSTPLTNPAPTTAIVTPTATPTLTPTTPAVTAPPVKSTPHPPRNGGILASIDSVDGVVNLISSGTGFSLVVDDGNSTSSQVLIYSATGDQIDTLSSNQLTADCGAEDLVVPGEGRVIVTEEIHARQAAGVRAGHASLDMYAWQVSSGDKLWQVPLFSGRPSDVSCGADTANGGYLQNFGYTANGRWGMYNIGEGAHDILINLATGQHRGVSENDALLGNYLGAGAYNGGRYALTDPAGGSVLGHVPAYNDGSNPQLVSIGLGYTDSAADSPDAVLTTNQRAMLSLPESDDGNSVTLAMPSGEKLWTGGTYLWGDAGGIALEDTNGKLVGYDDQTGNPRWHLPEPDDVCAMTNSQALLYIHGQYAVIRLSNGHQLSYSRSFDGTNGGDCPTIAADGTTMTEDNYNDYTVRQSLQP